MAKEANKQEYHPPTFIESEQSFVNADFWPLTERSDLNFLARAIHAFREAKTKRARNKALKALQKQEALNTSRIRGEF